MKETIDKFMGLAPKLLDNLPIGYATVAENVDLSNGHIRPFAKHLSVSALGGGSDSIKYWRDAWHYGADRWFTEWTYEEIEILFSLGLGVGIKNIAGQEANLGQDKPAAITAVLNGAGVLTGDYQYFIVTKRTINGYEDLSGPSDPTVELTAAANTIRVTRGAVTDADVTDWWIYRLSNTTGVWNFVAEVDIADTFYDDNNADADVSVNEGPITWYSSPQTGNDIILGPPPYLDGLCQELWAGMLVGWQGSDIFFSEPLLPDGWQETYFRIRAPFPIKAVLPLSGILVALTTHGPYRLDGTDPELITLTGTMSKEPNLEGRAAVTTQRGLFYFSDSGIANFDTIGTTTFSDTEFNEKWFKDNVPAGDVWLAYNDDQLYFGYGPGILVCDLRGGTRNWYLLDTVATAAYRRGDNGELYLCLDDGIYQAHSLPYFMDSDLMTWTWRSGDIYDTKRGQVPQKFTLVRVEGSGDVLLEIFIDGVSVGSKTMVFNAHERDRSLRVPTEWTNADGDTVNRGRTLQFEISGTGTVEEVTVEG